MTDNEIIKWAEECTSSSVPCCAKCPFDEDTITPDECMGKLMKELIKINAQQKAEIESLKKQIEERKKDVNYFMAQTRIARESIKPTKIEAVKKFAHQLKILLETKAKLYSLSDKDGEFAIVQSTALKTVDNLVEEMVGDNG